MRTNVEHCPKNVLKMFLKKFPFCVKDAKKPPKGPQKVPVLFLETRIRVKRVALVGIDSSGLYRKRFQENPENGQQTVFEHLRKHGQKTVF